jgi:hypothetical protein
MFLYIILTINSIEIMNIFVLKIIFLSIRKHLFIVSPSQKRILIITENGFSMSRINTSTNLFNIFFLYLIIQLLIIRMEAAIKAIVTLQP